MPKTRKVAWILGFLLGSAWLSFAAVPGQAPPPQPLTLHAEPGVGAPTDTPGINRIDVVLMLSFDGPVQKADLEDVVLKGADGVVPPEMLKAAVWTSPDSRTLRLAIPLESLLKSGLKYLPGTSTLSLECDVNMRGGSSYLARFELDVSDANGVTQPFQAVARPSTAKPPLPPPTSSTSVRKPQIAIVVTKPNPDKKSPFDEEPLTIPLAGAEVLVEYADQGRLVHQTLTMPAKGNILLDVPIDTPVTLNWEKETRTVTCTAKAPVQSVVFSTLKLKTVSTAPIIR